MVKSKSKVACQRNLLQTIHNLLMLWFKKAVIHLNFLIWPYLSAAKFSFWRLPNSYSNKFFDGHNPNKNTFYLFWLQKLLPLAYKNIRLASFGLTLISGRDSRALLAIYVADWWYAVFVETFLRPVKVYDISIVTTTK